MSETTRRLPRQCAQELLRIVGEEAERGPGLLTRQAAVPARGVVQEGERGVAVVQGQRSGGEVAGGHVAP